MDFLDIWRDACAALDIPMAVLDSKVGFIRLGHGHLRLDVLLDSSGEETIKFGCNDIVTSRFSHHETRRISAEDHRRIKHFVSVVGQGSIQAFNALVKDRMPALVEARAGKFIRVVDTNTRRLVLMELAGLQPVHIRIEDFMPESWQLLVVNGQVAAVLERNVVRIVGDGKLSIEDLVGRFFGPDNENPPASEALPQGMKASDVLAPGCLVELAGPFPHSGDGAAVSASTIQDALSGVGARVYDALGLRVLVVTVDRSPQGRFVVRDANTGESFGKFALALPDGPTSAVQGLLRAYYHAAPACARTKPHGPYMRSPEHELEDPTANELRRAAEGLGLACRTLDSTRRVMRIEGAGRWLDILVDKFPALSCNGNAAARFISSKHLAHRLFREHGIPAPEFQAFDRRDYNTLDALEREITEYATDRYPVVVKPSTGSLSIGVTVNIRDQRQLREAVRHAARQSSTKILVEEHINGSNDPVPGTDYRINVCRGSIVNIGFRTPLHIVGDGTSSCRDLIETENRARIESGLGRIPTNAGGDTMRMLSRAGFGLDDVPPAGLFINLFQAELFGRATGFLEPGTFHLDNIKMFIDAAALTGLEWVGFDFIIEDPARSFKELRSAITDVNNRPVIPPVYSRFYIQPLLEAYFGARDY